MNWEGQFHVNRTPNASKPPSPPSRSSSKFLAWSLGILLVGGLIWYWQHSTNYKERGIEAYKARDYDRAIALFTSLVQKEPTNLEGYYYRAVCHLTRREFEQALRDVKRLSGDWILSSTLMG